MMAVLSDIADAITTELNGHTWSQAFTAERSYADWNEKLVDAEVLHVDVVPWRTADDELDDRGEITYRCDIDVLIRKRFGLTDQQIDGRIANEDVDDLLGLHQEIREFWLPSHDNVNQTGRRLTDVPNASWVATRSMADYVRPHFKQHRQYTGWLRITFELSRVPGT